MQRHPHTTRAIVKARAVRLCCLFALIMFSAPALQAAENATVRHRLALPAGGSLELEAPAGWRKHQEKASGSGSRRIEFASPRRSQFSVSIVASSPKSAAGSQLDNAGLRRRVEYDAQGLRLFAKGEVTVLELDARAGPGFYFVAVDKAPGPGGYELLARGRLAVNDTLVSFTLLAHAQSTIQDALAMLKGATYQPGKAASPKR